MNESEEFPYSHFRSQAALQAGKLMLQIVLPVLLVLGTIGNMLSVIVLSRKAMKKSVSSTFLLGLSVADLLVLYVCLMRDWIRYIKTDVRHAANWTCKGQYWLHYALLDFSIWLLTALTVERFLSTFKPISKKILCTRWRAKRVIICILIVDLIVHCHFLFGMELKPVRSGNGSQHYSCGPASDGYDTFFKYVWHYIDLSLFSIVPFLILSSSNIYIIYKVISNKRKLKRHTGTSCELTENKTSSMSKLLVALNVIFIVSTAPICIYLVCRPYVTPPDVPVSVQEEDPWYAFVKILMYTNNTVNFILYCVSGTKFRRELKRLFQKVVHRYRSVSLTASSQRSTSHSPASMKKSTSF